MDYIQLNRNGIKINGEYKVLLCSSLFYFRIPKEHWQDRIDMIKNAGYNCVDIYFPWNYHEICDGKWNFENDRDVARFLSMVADAGLYIIARPGPYICSEWDGGALPSRICGGDYNLRTNDKDYLAEVEKWFDKIIPLISAAQIQSGGKVILLQLENELDFFDCSDVDGYISALRDMARRGGITVPMFACAGQSHTYKAGGTVSGVEPTFNFYPDSKDRAFDEVLLSFNSRLSEINKPLLISETNRDHFLLRRELAAGAKLLGAYNQVAGNNFSFYSSINNWGKPLAFLATNYDFGSLVDSMGEYSNEIDNARELGMLIDTFKEELAAATSDVSDTAYFEFKGEKKSLLTLRLKNGGYLISAANYSDKTEHMHITANNQTFCAEVNSYAAPFLPIGVNLKALGGNGVINWSANELLGVNAKRLYFKSAGICAVSLTVEGKDYRVEKDGTYGGIEISFLNASDIRKLQGYEKGFNEKHTVLPIDKLALYKDVPTFRSVENDGNINMEALASPHGYVKYTVNGFKKGLFIEDAADILSTVIDDKYYDSRICTGNCQVYPSGQTAVIKAESWGHSNFDDARNRSLRMSSKKGICGAYEIEELNEQKLFKFKLLDEFLTSKVDITHDDFYPLLGVSKWNSTRQPVICMYSFAAKRTSDKLYVKVESSVEAAVYADGVFVAKADYEYVDLSGATELGKDTVISIVYRKANWAVDCGKVFVFSLRQLAVKTQICTEKDIVGWDYTKGKTVSIPHKLEKGAEYLGQIILKGNSCRELCVDAKDAKITFVINGRVVGRIMGDWDGAPEIAGGRKKDFYVPSAWIEQSGGVLSFYIEALGENPKLVSIKEKLKA